MIRFFLTLSLLLSLLSLVSCLPDRRPRPNSRSRDLDATFRDELDIHADVEPGKPVFMADVMEDIVRDIQGNSIGEPDLNVGPLVNSWRPDQGTNPEELGTYMEGDMLIPPSDFPVRSGIIGASFRWPKGIVYYRIDESFTDAQHETIMNAINEYHKHTCIQFRPYTGVEPDFISIQGRRSGCWSSVGRVGGMQRINLQTPGCLYYIGTTIHELMHALGFYHEQSRTDRGDFISIIWENIRDGSERNFKEHPSSAFGIRYDYGSVMHYSSYAFSRNRQRTIIPKRRGARIGQRFEFSAYDIFKIRAMYKCNGFNSEL